MSDLIVAAAYRHHLRTTQQAYTPIPVGGPRNPYPTPYA